MRPDNERNKMKTMRKHTALTATAALLGLACVSPAFGSSAASTDKIYEGNVTSVNASDKTVSVRGFMFTRNFHTASDCKVSLQDRGMVSLGDLRPGEEVNIRYTDDNGVLIAKNIAQHNLAFRGHITAINPGAGTILVRHGLVTHDFSLGPSYAVVMKDNKTATLNNLQLGDAVCVVFEPFHGSKMVQRIVQDSSTFVGTIAALDPATRSLKAIDAHGEKMFSVANNCPIVINGKWDESLRHLQVGERVTVNYDNADGVLVANRISPIPAGTPAAPAPAQAATGNNNQNNQWHDYSYVAP
jgi:Cu/Ag efflux protein CusF